MQVCSLEKSRYWRLPCSDSDALILKLRDLLEYVDSLLFGGSLEDTLLISLSNTISVSK